MEPRILTDPQVLADLLSTFGADTQHLQQPWSMDGEVAVAGGLGEVLGDGIRFEANGREWRVLQVGQGDEEVNQPSYRSDAQLRDAARVLPPVCFAPLVSQYTRLLRDPRWAVTAVPAIMSAMLHDPVLFHVMDANPLAPLSEYRVSAMTRWWGVAAKPVLRYENNTGRPLFELLDGTEVAAAAADGEDESSTAERADGGQTESSTNSRMPLDELRRGYQNIKTVLTLIAATSAPYRCSRPPNASVSGCTARLVFCKDPSTIYIGLLLNTVLRELPRKVLCSMPVFRVIAEGWGNSPSLCEILQAAWEEYQDVLQEIRAVLGANSPTPSTEEDVTGHASSAASSSFAPPTMGTTMRSRGVTGQQQPPPRRALPRLHLPAPSREGSDASSSGVSPASSPHAATATAEGGQHVQLGIPMSRARTSMASRTRLFGSTVLTAQRMTAGAVDGARYNTVSRTPTQGTAAAALAAGGRTSRTEDANSTYHTEDANRICLESMQECAQSPEMLLWWARCRLLAYQLLDSTSRVGVESTRALEYFRQVWACTRLAREILEDDQEALLSASLLNSATLASRVATSAEEEEEKEERSRHVASPSHADGGDEATQQQRQRSLTALQQRARRLYASLVGTIADLSKFWFSIRVAQSTLTAVGSSAPENNVIWSIVNATVPPRRRFQREEFASYAEHWQYALLVDDYVTQPMGFRVSTRGRTMVTQLLHVLSEYPTFYPALVTRTLAMLNRREMIVAELNGRLVAAVARCLRFYLPPMPPVLALPATAASTTAATITPSAVTPAPPSRRAPDTRSRRSSASSPESDVSSSASSATAGLDGFRVWPRPRVPRSPLRRATVLDDAAAATAAEEDTAGGAEAASSGLNYEAYVLRCTEDDEFDGDEQSQDEEEETSKRHPRLRRRAARRAAAARHEDEARRHEAAMPVLTTKAYDAILTCLDVLRMLVRNAHLSVNPMGILFAIPAAASVAEETATKAIPAASTSDGTPSRAPSVSHDDEHDGVASDTRRRALRYEPVPPKPQCDLYTLLHQLVYQTRYGPLATAALRLFSACVHYNVRDMVPLFTERGLLNTVLAIAHRPYPASAQHPHGEVPSPAGEPAPLLFALDMMEETGQPNVPRRDGQQDVGATTTAAAERPSSRSSPLVTAHPPRSLLVRYIPREDGYLNRASIRVVLPEFVEAMTVHQATHELFRKRLQWIPALLKSLTVSPALSTTTLSDIRALWEDEEAFDVADDAPVAAERGGDEEESEATTFLDTATVQQQYAQLACRSSLAYKGLLRGLLKSRRTSGAAAADAPQQGSSTPTGSAQGVDATLIRLLELCRLHLKREEVGYRILQGSVKDMSRVLTEVLQPSIILTSAFRPAIHHELSQLHKSVRQFAQAVRSAATHERPFLASSYPASGSTLASNTVTSDLAVSSGASSTVNSLNSSSREWETHGSASVSGPEATARMRRRQQSSPKSREDALQLLVRATELCRTFNNFFAFFSAMDWTGQRRGPRLARNNAERQESAQAMRDILSGTVATFHKTIQQLWFLMGCQVPLNLRGKPLSLLEQGIPDGESSLLSYVQVVIGQCMHPRIFGDYLRSTQPSSTLEAVLRSTVRCILHHSTRSLFYLHQCAGDDIEEHAKKRKGADWRSQQRAENEFLQDELKRLLSASEIPAGNHGGGAASATSPRIGETEGTALTRHLDPNRRTEEATQGTTWQEPVQFELTDYPCRDLVSSALRPLSMGDGVFLRQLLEAWRSTTVSGGGSGSSGGFENVVGGPNRRDGDDIQWRGVFGELLRYVVDAIIVRAPVTPEEVPSLLRSVRSVNVHGGLPNGVLSLYDRSTETGAALVGDSVLSAEVQSGRAQAPARDENSGVGHANAINQLMQSLLQDNRNYVGEPTTTWMTAEAWREATDGDARTTLAHSAAGAGVGSVPPPASPDALSAAAAVAGSSASGVAASSLPPLSSPPVLTLHTAAAVTSGLEDVVVTVDGEGGAGVENSQESSLASAVSSSVRTPTLQTTLAGIPPHLMESGGSQPLQRTAEGRVDAGHEGDAAERLSVVAQPAAAAELSRGGTPPPLFTPLNPTKALQQWTFMTLFNGRRNGMEQAMHDFFHIAAFRRESRARAVLPLNAAALVRALQEDLTTAFETAVRGVYADAVTRDQCCRGTAEIRESEPEKHARAVDEVVAARRRQRAASRRSTAAQVGGNGASVTSTADSLFEVPGCPWLEAKPRDLATMTLPTLTNIDECLEDINLGAAHRALWELAVLDAVSAGGSSNIRGVQDTYLWDLVKTLTRAAQLLILLSRLFLAPGAQTTHERPRYTMVSEAEGEALDAAAATASRAVVAAQSDLRRCLVYMGVLMMNFLEGCDSRVRGQHHFVVESLLYCVLDVWPALPGFPMLPHMYVSAVDLMSQLKADTFDYVRLQKLLNYPSPRPAKSAEAVAGGGRVRETSPGRRAADAHDDDSEGGPNESVHRERSNLAGFYGLDGSGDTAGHGGRPHPSASRPQRPSVSPQSSPTFLDYLSHEIERDRFPSPGPLRDISAAEAMSADLLRRRFMHLGQPYADSFHREADRTRFSSEFTVHDAPLGRPRLLSSLPTPGDLGSGAIPNAPLWERMLPWLCDVVTGNVFPLNALSETGLRLLRRRACKVLWSLWTLTKSPEQPFVLAYMLHRVLSDTRRNVVLLEYMGVLLSQIRGVVVVEALALTPLPRVVVRVVRDAIEAVGKEREEWERDAAAERAAATTVEAQRMLRDSRRRRRRMFAALSETLHGQLVSFLTLFQNTGSDAPLLKDRFKRTSATPQYAQMAGTQCNYFDATRSTFCWHGHQCHRHHVVPVNGQRNRDEEEQRFSLFTFGTGSQRVVDEMLTVLEHHGFESMPVFRGSKGPAQAEAAPKAHRAKHESFMSTPQTTTTTAPSAMPGAVRHVSPAMNPREEGEGEERASAPQLPPTQGYSLLDSGTTSHHPSLVEASARSVAEISPLRVTFTRTSRGRYAEGEEDSTSLSASALVRHERLTPHGFVSMLEGAERQAAGAEANFAGAAVRTGGSRLTPRSRDGRAGVQRRAGSRAGDVNTRTDDNDDGGQARSPQQFEHLFHRHRQPEEPRGGSAVTTHQHIAALNRGAAGDAVGHASSATAQQSLDHEWGGTLPDSSLAAPARAPISDESGPLRHSLTNPLDGRRHRVDCLRRAIIPYYALFSREICEEVLRLCLDFMAARLRDEAMDKAESAEDDAYWAREQQQKQKQQEATASLQVRDAGSASTAGPAITEEAAHESRGTATGSSATTPSPLLHAPHAPSAFNSADSASAAAPAPSTTTARTAAASAVTHLAAQMKLPPVEVTECPVGEVMINFLLTSFFTYYHSCLHLVQTHRLSGGGDKATSEVLGGGANGSVEEPDALSVLCAYVTSVSLPNREKCIILCKLLLTDMAQIEDDIWRDMSRVLTSAVQVHHKAQKLTDKSHTALTAFHERRLHALAATAAPTDSSASPAAASAQSMAGQRKHVAARDWGQHHHATAAAAAATPLATFSSPAPIHAHGPTRDEGAGRERHQGTRKAPAVDGEGEGQEVEEDVEGLHRYVVPVGIFLANLEAYIIRQPTAFYAAFQRHCEVRWVEARKGDVPAAWLGVWVQPRPDSRASARANTAASEVHVGRSARAGRRARTAAAASTATTSMPSIAPAVPSPKFVNRVSCFMQQLTRNVESGLSRASHGVEILAAVEQLPSVCAALLALPDNFPVPKSFASILATCTSASAISGEAGVASNPLCQQQPRDEGNEEEEASRAADRASNRIAVPPFIALLLYFCGTLSEADRSNPYDFAAGIDFAAELLAFNPIVVADAVVDTVQQLVTALEGIREGAEEAAGMGGDVEREQASATAAGTTPGDGHGTTRAREETNEAREARRRSLVRCLHGLLCFLECGSPRQATAALPARQRASQQQQHSGGKHVQEAFLRFYKHLGEQGLLPLLFRVCRLRTCEHGRDATSLLQLLHHQLLAFGEYRMATMLSPAQKAYVEQQQQGIQQRQRQTGMTGSGASRWPQMFGPGVSPAGAAFRRDPFPEGMPELATINAQAQRFASVDFGLGRPSSAYAQHRLHDVLLHMPDGVQVEVADEVAAAIASVRGGGEEEAEGNADASSTYSSSSSVSDYRSAAAALRGANHLGDIFEPMRPLRRRHHPRHSLNAEEAVDEGEGDHTDAAEENALALAIEEAPLREHDPAVALADTVMMEENSAGALASGDVVNANQSASGSSPADEPSYEDEWENYTSSSVADEAERGGEGETLATLGLAEEDEGPLAQALTSGEANTAPGAQPGLFGALASPIWEFVMSEGNSSAEEAAEGVEGEDEEEEGEEEEDEEEGDDDGDGEEEEDEEVEEEYTSNLEEESEHAGYGSSDGDGDGSFLGDSGMEDRFLTPQVLGRMLGHRHGGHGGGGGGAGGMGGAGAAATAERAQTFAACAYHAILKTVRRLHRGNVVETERPMLPVLHATEEQAATEETESTHGNVASTRLRSEGPVSISSPAHRVPLSPPAMRNRTPSEQLMRRQRDSATPRDPLSTPHRQDSESAMMAAVMRAEETQTSTPTEVVAGAMASGSGAQASRVAGESPELPTVTEAASNDSNNNSNNNAGGVDDVTARILALFAAGSATAAASAPAPAIPDPVVAVAPSEPTEPEPWEGVLDVQFLNEMPEDVRSEILFDSMQTLRGPEEREVLGRRTRLYQGFLQAMPEAAQRHAMEVEARWVRVTRADDNASELYQTIISVDAETRRDLLLQCELELLQPYPELLREATELRAEVERQREELEAAQRAQEERRQRHREAVAQQTLNQRNPRRWTMESNDLLRDREERATAGSGLRVSAPGVQEMETVDGVMHVLFGATGPMYTIINHEVFLARRLYRCEAVLHGLQGPSNTQSVGPRMDGGVVGAAPSLPWVMSPLLEEVNFGPFRLRHGGGGGARGGNVLQRLPPTASPLALPFSSLASNESGSHQRLSPTSSSPLSPLGLGEAAPSPTSVVAAASAATGESETFPSGVPTAVAALSECIVPVQESPYHPLALPIPSVPEDVLFNCLELLRLRATAAFSLPFNATAGISCLDQQLQHLLQLLMGNPASAVRLLCQLLDVMTNTPTVADAPAETVAAATAPAVATQATPTAVELATNQMFIKGVTAFLVSLIKQNQAMAASFFLLPDGALNTETLKAVDAPMDALERRCAEYGLWNRLWRMCRQHIHIQGFLYSLDQLLRQLVRSQKMFHNAAEDNEITVSEDPLSAEPLSESLILHPRHPHRLRWTNIRRLPNYEEAGYVCNVCGVNPGFDYCFHCSSCQFDLCPCCSRERLTLEEMQLRISRSSALILMAVPETVTSMTAFLRHPLCRPNIATSVVQLMSRPLQECAARECASPLSTGTGAVSSFPSLSYASSNSRGTAHASLSAASPLQLLEQELVQMAETRVRAMKEARDVFRQEVHTIFHSKANASRGAGSRGAGAGGSLGAAPGALSMTGIGGGGPGRAAHHVGQPQLSIPDDYVFDTDTAMALLVKLDIKDSEGDAIQRLFEPYVATSGVEPRAFTMLWRASQAYLHDVSALLEHLTPQEVLPLPSCVSSILQTFCRYHLSEVHLRGVSASARALTGSRSNLAGETEHFLRASTKPSSVSDRAVKELSEQEDAAQWVTAVGTRLSEEGLNPTEEQQRRLPHVVRMILEENRVTLNTLLHWDSSLLKENFSFLKYEPNLIDFNFKLSDFRRRLGLRRGSNILLRVNRANCLLDSFKELQKQRSLGGQLHVRFEGEEGADAGGLTKEWLQILSEALVDERYALFVHSQDSASFQPNPFSSVNPNHLDYFQFAGVVVALAITHNVPIDIHFTRAFYRHIIGHRPVFADLQSFDPELYTNLNWIMENDVTNLALTFAVNYNRFGSVEEEELEPNGKNTMVTNANKQQYVRLLCEFHLTRRTEEQLLRFLKGFYSVIPRREVQCFTENELELVISGMPDIDVEDLRTHTVYEGYSTTSPQIRWFWEAVSAMTKEDLANLLQFTTGSSKVPHGGFGHLEGSNGRSLPFTISRWAVDKDDRLPQAHTCFNKIDLPVYASAALLKEKLMLAITYGSMGFTMV